MTQSAELMEKESIVEEREKFWGKIVLIYQQANRIDYQIRG